MRIAFLAFGFPIVCLAQAPAPRLTLEAPHHDFGPIAPVATVSCRFKVTNTGNAPLTISKLIPTCGCTSTTVGRSSLAPGESTELEVTFRAEGYRGLTQKSVQVVSNDPTAPVQTLTLEANVLPEVVPSTDVVRFEDLVRGDRRKASVKITNGTGHPMELRDMDLSEAPWLGVATREGSRELWVDFELVARRLPPDKLSGVDTVTLHLANPRPSLIKISVHWERRAPVRATPARLAWAEPAGQELRAPVRLDSRNHKPFRILSARTSNPLLKVSGLSPRASVSQAIQVVLSSTAPPGVYEEKAILTLDTPGHPEFEFRVAASLR